MTTARRHRDQGQPERAEPEVAEIRHQRRHLKLSSTASAKARKCPGPRYRATIAMSIASQPYPRWTVGTVPRRRQCRCRIGFCWTSTVRLTSGWGLLSQRICSSPRRNIAKAHISLFANNSSRPVVGSATSGGAMRRKTLQVRPPAAQKDGHAGCVAGLADQKRLVRSQCRHPGDVTDRLRGRRSVALVL